MSVAVVGAGVAGLAAAYAARRAGLDVVVLEASARAGGLVETERTHGLLIEHGADALLEAKPVGMHVVRELGLDGEIVRGGPAPRRAFLATDDGLVPMPDGMGGMMPRSPWSVLASPLLSARAKLRLLSEPLAPDADHEETVREFADRRLGAEVRAQLVDPLMRAIYGVRSERLGLTSALPHLAAAEQRYGSLARAMWSARGSPPGLATLRDGMSELVAALIAAIGRERIHVRRPVSSIERRGRGHALHLGGDTIHADAVIVAVPAWAAAELLAPLDARLADELAAIEHVNADVVSLAYPRARVRHPLDGTGHLVARASDATRACTWASAKWPGRAPEDVVLVRAVLDAAVDERELVAIARRELEATLGVEGEPLLVRVRRRERALPIPSLGHRERRGRIAARARAIGGLAIAGAAEGALGVPDCLASGLRALSAVSP